MAVVILVNKKDNTVFDLFDRGITYTESSVDFVGGSASGFDPKKIGIVFTNDVIAELRLVKTPTRVFDEVGMPTIKDIPTKQLIFLKDGGDILNIGDPMPYVTDVKEKFITLTAEGKRLDDIEMLIAELLSNGVV